MNKTSAIIITTITTALVIISLAYALYAPTNSANASIDPDWQLTVTGLAENPLNLNWTEIAAMPKTTVNAAIICVDFPRRIVAQGNWTGIKLQTLLEEAETSASAIKIAFYASDGYSTDLPVETAMHDDIILAYEKDGEPLNNLRLVVPGKWGYKWITQLTRIELVDYNFLGFWESRGYSDEANVSEGEQNAGEFPALPKTEAPSPSPSTPLAASPSPSLTFSVPSQPTQPPDPEEDIALSKEAIYAIAASVAAGVLIIVLAFRRKLRNNS